MTKILDAVLKGSPPALKGYTIFTSAFEQMIKQRNALINDDWSRLEKLANQGLGQAYGAYGEISRDIGIAQAQSDEANEAFRSFLKFQAGHKETRKDFYSEVKKQVLKARPDISTDWLTALDALGEGKLGHNVVLESLQKREVESPDMIGSAIEATVALALRSLMALTYAGFHNHYRQISKYPFVAHKDELIPVIEIEVKKFEKDLESGLKRLYANMRDGLSPQSSCEDLLRLLEQSVPAFGRIQATVRLYALSLKDGDMEAASEQVGQLAAKAGDLTRSAFASYAAAYNLCLQGRMARIDPKIKRILEPEKKLAYDAKFPTGKHFQISKIDKAKNGAFVEVAGFVVSLTTRRESDAKLISELTLLDPVDDSTVEAVGIFAHLRHLGLQEGAYCVLNGLWRSQSKLNQNKPAVEIDKLSISELSKKSWKIRFQDSSDRFFDRWPGGLNMSYGLSPHVSKAEAGESKILGAGELIFKPFTR